MIKASGRKIFLILGNLLAHHAFRAGEHLEGSVQRINDAYLLWSHVESAPCRPSDAQSLQAMATLGSKPIPRANGRQSILSDPSLCAFDAIHQGSSGARRSATTAIDHAWLHLPPIRIPATGCGKHSSNRNGEAIVLNTAYVT
jgi:hypothetical protein